MATTTGSHPKELWPGIKKIFGCTYDEKALICSMVFDETSSDKAYEEYVEETGSLRSRPRARASSMTPTFRALSLG